MQSYNNNGSNDNIEEEGELNIKFSEEKIIYKDFIYLPYNNKRDYQ